MPALSDQLPTRTATGAGEGHGKYYVGPGWEHLGALYGEKLADLEDLRAYLLTGSHPVEEMRRARHLLPRSDSQLSSRPSSAASMADV